MSELMKLDNVCLINIPMMLDVISNTVNKLRETLCSEYDNLDEYLKQHLENQYNFTDDWKRGVIYVFTEQEYKRRYLSTLSPNTSVYILVQ